MGYRRDRNRGYWVPRWWLYEPTTTNSSGVDINELKIFGWSELCAKSTPFDLLAGTVQRLLGYNIL